MLHNKNNHSPALHCIPWMSPLWWAIVPAAKSFLRRSLLHHLLEQLCLLQSPVSNKFCKSSTTYRRQLK